MLEKDKTIFPNVRMAGVEIGGLTQGEARDRVETAVAQAYTAASLDVVLPDRTITFSRSRPMWPWTPRRPCGRPWPYGRGGGTFETLLNYIKCKNTPMDIPLETALEFDKTAISDLIQETAVMTRQAPQDSAMVLNEASNTIEITRGREGRELNAEALNEAVCQAFETGNFTALTWGL